MIRFSLHDLQRLALLGVALMAVLSGCRPKAADPGGGEGDAANTDPVTVEMTTATVRPMETTLSAQGTLSPGQGASAKIAATVPGRLIAVNVREGQPVQRNQVIAVIDNRPQRAAVSSAAAALTTTEAQARSAALATRSAAADQQSAVHLAQMSLEAATLDRNSSIEQAKNALLTAQTDLQKTQAGARPQEIAQAEQAVVQAQATHDRAVTELDRQKRLFDVGISAKRDVDDAQTALNVSTAALESAKQQSSLMRAGARPEDLRAAQLRVDAANAALALARKTGDAKIAQAQAQMRQAEQGRLQVAVKQQDARAMQEMTRQKQADLQAAQATAGYAEVRSPLNGIVTRRALNPGDYADTTNPIIEVADIHSLNLIANLPAEDSQKVHVGQAAHITSQDAPGKDFPGRVMSVGQIDPQTNLLTARIAVFNAARLRVGTFATAEIVVQSEKAAVVVPKPAIVSREGKTVLFVVGPDNIAHMKEVQVGPEKDGMVAIDRGAKAGDRIVQVGNYELTDGAKVREAPKEEKTEEAKGAKDETK